MAEQENKISNIDLDENKGDNTAGPPSVNGVNELSEERRLEIETEVAKVCLLLSLFSETSICNNISRIFFLCLYLENCIPVSP